MVFDGFGVSNLLSSRVGRKKGEFSDAHSCIVRLGFMRNAIDTRVDNKLWPILNLLSSRVGRKKSEFSVYFLVNYMVYAQCNRTQSGHERHLGRSLLLI